MAYANSYYLFLLYYFRYYLMFEARKGIGKWSDVAIDDISMSPKCFGLGELNLFFL